METIDERMLARTPMQGTTRARLARRRLLVSYNPAPGRSLQWRLDAILDQLRDLGSALVLGLTHRLRDVTIRVSGRPLLVVQPDSPPA